MRISFKVMAILFLMNMAPAVKAQETLPFNTKLKLPSVQGVKAQWVLPPSIRAEKSPEYLCFDIDKKGIPWFGYKHGLIASPLNQVSFLVDRPFEDFAWLSTVNSWYAPLLTSASLARNRAGRQKV